MRWRRRLRRSSPAVAPRPRFAEVVVPFMALAYILMALFVVAMNISELPHVFTLIIKSAFGIEQAASLLWHRRHQPPQLAPADAILRLEARQIEVALQQAIER